MSNPQFSDLPAGAQVVSAPSQPAPAQSTSQFSDLPQGATVVSHATPTTQPQTEQPQEPSTLNGVQEANFSEHPFWSTAEHLSNMGTNFIKGAVETGTGIAHATHMINDDQANYLKQYTGKSAGNTADRVVGYGGETLLEFLAGDEALKGLPLVTKLKYSAQILETLEKSPRLMQALKAGASLSKISAELGPEEQAMLKKFPAIARRLAVDSAVAGVTQGVQTGIRTGDAHEAAKEGVAVGAQNFGVGMALAAPGAVISKFKDAADTVKDLGSRAKAAKTTTEIGDAMAHQIQTAADPIQAQAGESVVKAHDAAVNPLQNRAASATTEASNAMNDASSEVVQRNAEAQEAAVKSKQLLKNFAAGAPDSRKGIAEDATQAAKIAKDARRANYLGGIDDITESLGDATIPHEGSPLQDVAKEMIGISDNVKKKPLAKVLGETLPISDKAMKLVKALAGDGTLAEEGEEVEKASKGGAGFVASDVKPQIDPTDVEQPLEYSISDLIGKTEGDHWQERRGLRQILGERMAQLKPDNPDRQVYRKLIDGLDETVAQLAEDNGQDHVADQLRDMNSKYREGAKQLQNRDVRAILSGGLNDFNKRLTGGATSIEDIKAVKSFIGDQKFNQLAKDSLQRIVADAIDEHGNLDHGKAIRELAGIKPETRVAMMGNLGDKVLDALNEVATTNDRAELIGKHAAQMGEDPDAFMRKWSKMSAADKVNTFGDSASTIDRAVQAQESAMNAHKGLSMVQDMSSFERKYATLSPEERTALLGKDHAETAFAVGRVQQTQNAMEQINKNVADLINGNVDTLANSPERIAALQKMVGPANMKVLGKMVLENEIAKASSYMDATTGEFSHSRPDPEKVLQFWSKFKDNPEGRNALFLQDSQAALEYNKLMQRIGNAAGVKKLIKYGLIPLAGTAGVVHSTGAIFLGTVAAAAGESGWGKVAQIADNLANDPKMWKYIGKVGSVGQKAAMINPVPAVAAANAAAQSVSDRKAQVYSGTSTTLK